MVFILRFIVLISPVSQKSKYTLDPQKQRIYISFQGKKFVQFENHVKGFGKQIKNFGRHVGHGLLYNDPTIVYPTATGLALILTNAIHPLVTPHCDLTQTQHYLFNCGAAGGSMILGAAQKHQKYLFATGQRAYKAAGNMVRKVEATKFAQGLAKGVNMPNGRVCLLKHMQQGRS